MCTQAKPLQNNFNAGELDPILEYRVDLEKRMYGMEEVTNALVQSEGALMRRPGTEFVGEITVGQDIDNITYPRWLVAHAGGYGSLGTGVIAQTDNAPSVVWYGQGAGHDPLSVDVDENGYSVFSIYNGAGNIDTVEPIEVYDRDGTNQNIDFEFGSALGDTTSDTSDNSRIAITEDGTYIYYCQIYTTGGNSVRLHKYDRTGSRIWRVAYADTLSTAVTISVSKDGIIYGAFGEGPTKYFGLDRSCGVAIDPSDGSKLRQYTDVQCYGGVINDSVICYSTNKVYYAREQPNAQDLPTAYVAFYANDLDSTSVSTITLCGSNYKPRYICTDETYIYAIGSFPSSHNVIKLKASDLSVVTSTSISGINANRIWVDKTGHIVITGETINGVTKVLDADDLSVLETVNFGDTLCTSSGLGDAEHYNYYGWPTGNEVVVRLDNHGYLTGNSVEFSGVGGTTELNGNTYTITRIDDNLFYLNDTDYTAMTEYTSGGSISISSEKPARMLPFEYSDTDAYVLVLTDELMSFWRTTSD